LHKGNDFYGVSHFFIENTLFKRRKIKERCSEKTEFGIIWVNSRCKFFLNEWYANGKVCYCKACEVASKCVADIEQTEKMTGK